MLAVSGRSERGNALIEFSLLIPILLLLCLGVIDFSLYLRGSMILTNAAHAGALYGASIAKSADLMGMQTAAANTAQGLPGFSAVAQKWCSCSPGGASVSCASSCGTYGAPIIYVQVTTRATLTAMFNYPGIPLTVPMGATSVARVN